MAGLTVALVSIPVGMAHTMVAAEIIEEAGIEEAKQVLLAALMMEDQDGGQLINLFMISAQAPGYTQQLCCPGDLPSHPAQANRTSLIDAYNHPGHTSNPSDPLIWTELPSMKFPCMIQSVDWHEIVYLCLAEYIKE